MHDQALNNARVSIDKSARETQEEACEKSRTAHEPTATLRDTRATKSMGVTKCALRNIYFATNNKILSQPQDKDKMTIWNDEGTLANH